VDQKLVTNSAMQDHAWRGPANLRKLVCVLGVACGIAAATAGEGDNPDLETVFQFTLAPSGVTLAPDGTWVLGVNQSEKPRLRAVRITKSGEVTPFPSEKMSLGDASVATPLDAVESLQVDQAGLIWLLDNGRRSEIPPKVIGWNDDKQRVQQVLYLSPPAIVAGSFASDIVVDTESSNLFISDPANGANAAIIVLDRATGINRRCLQGHPSVVPDPSVTLSTTRTGKETKRLDGTALVPHGGVRSLVMDRKSQWLYFAPVQSRFVYRLPIALLRDPGVSDAKLASAIERYAGKPAAASLTIDAKNNLYVGDIQGRAIGVIDPDNREYRVLSSDARLLWPDGLCFGQDGKLYFYSRSQPSPDQARTGIPTAVEHRLFRMKVLASGQPGS
jgi:sugar lactone lactonase YvrE